MLIKERHSSRKPRGECRRVLTDTEQDLIRLANEPQFARWRSQVQRTGGCENPVHLSGWTTRYNALGNTVAHYDTTGEPGRRIIVRCGNRRKSQCTSCSYLHSGDSYQIIRTGMGGGKGTPESVAGHPQIFVTLTAPSFGAVHRAGPAPCRNSSPQSTCPHGRSLACQLQHSEGDERIGSALCHECYDYSGHVLWHAHAGELWNRTIRNIRRLIADASGVKRNQLNNHIRLTFAKVAEYQKRGAVHFHAVMRLDGPSGATSPPPAWATVELLERAVETARDSTVVPLRASSAVGQRLFAWGRQSDVRSLHGTARGEVTPEAVAGYLAKYVSKSVGDAGGVDSRIRTYEEIRCASASRHIRALMGACWRLGSLAEFSSLRLKAWAHALGYRGHVLTKSPAYSTTYKHLREIRADYARTRSDESVPLDGVLVLAAWRYVGRGYTPAEKEVAAGIREDMEEIRRLRRWGPE
ncbi:replication initiator [Streptomyces sp. CFMR 7]|uniref:replication initiator n=1 Tax=Streptomyces sp. CFMR 7 TaxID=1649184 RepID=UPI00119E8271|nr:replication initiator [Streptomyces sp. CFMR 7]